MSNNDLITQKEAAAILNRSVSAVSRAIKEGRLDYADPEHRLLHRPGLEQRFARTTRLRIDAPRRKAQMVPGPSRPESPVIATEYWQRVTDKLDCVLQGSSSYWPKFDAQSLKLFARVLDEVRAQAEMEGLESG